MSDQFARDLMAARPQLLKQAYKLCLNHDRAEDLASDVVAQAWKYRDSFQKGTNFAGWLYVILRNRFFTEQRRKRFDGGYIDDNKELRKMLSYAAPQEHHMALLDAERALKLIPEAQAEAVLFVATQGNYEEAAEATGVNLGTLKSRVGRGRAALEVLLS